MKKPEECSVVSKDCEEDANDANMRTENAIASHIDRHVSCRTHFIFNDSAKVKYSAFLVELCLI